jgi:hypothetical protein
MFTVFTNSAYFGSSGASKFACQSYPSTSIQCFNELGGQPSIGPCHHVGAPWRPYANCGPTGQFATSLKATTPSPGRLSLHSLILPPSVIAKAEKPSRNCYPCSCELTRAHHYTTIHQISPTTPPWTPLPPPPLSWANCVGVRAHCRIRHRPPQTFLIGAPPSLWPCLSRVSPPPFSSVSSPP